VSAEFSVGDRVRLRIEKKVFGKSDVLKYSKIIYLIHKIKGDKIYLTNTETETELKTYVKPAQLKAIGDIQYIDQHEKEHEPIHKEIQKERKMTRVLNKEGIEKVPELRRSARERKPNQLLTEKGERIIW
jgi:hypothetical protein